MFQSGNPSGRSALDAKAIRSLAQSTAAKRKAGRAQALKPVIDITQYFEVSFDPAQPVSQYIQDLYATGYIEAAEAGIYTAAVLYAQRPGNQQPILPAKDPRL